MLSLLQFGLLHIKLIFHGILFCSISCPLQSCLFFCRPPEVYPPAELEMAEWLTDFWVEDWFKVLLNCFVFLLKVTQNNKFGNRVYKDVMFGTIFTKKIV